MDVGNHHFRKPPYSTSYNVGTTVWTRNCRPESASWTPQPRSCAIAAPAIFFKSVTLSYHSWWLQAWGFYRGRTWEFKVKYVKPSFYAKQISKTGFIRSEAAWEASPRISGKTKDYKLKDSGHQIVMIVLMIITIKNHHRILLFLQNVRDKHYCTVNCLHNNAQQ